MIKEQLSIDNLREEDVFLKFLKRIKKDSDDSCWNWTGNKIKAGYGVFYIKRYYSEYAHRYSFMVHFNMEIPEGIQVCHRCDNPSCVKPAHLLLGTNLDNIKDKLSKGRQCKGQTHGLAILTENDVMRMRELHKQYKGEKNLLQRLSVEFDTPKDTVKKIVNRYSWKHLN